MNTARIVVLTTGSVARGIAAHLANLSDNKPLPAPNAPAATDQPIGIDGADSMTTASPPGARVPGLIPTLK